MVPADARMGGDFSTLPAGSIPSISISGARARRRWGILPLVLLILAAAAPPGFGWVESFDDIRSAAGGIRTVQADFVQEKHLPILARPIRSHGIMVFRKPDNLRWEYRAPVQSILMVRDGEAVRYVQSEAGLVRDTGSAVAAMQFVLPEITRWLNGRFAENPVFDCRLEADGSNSNKKVVMTPKAEDMAKFIQRVELRFSETPGMIDEAVIYEGPDAYTRFRFTGARLNAPVDDRMFTDVK